MNKTISQKILAKASGKDNIEPGEIVWAKVDVLMTHDPCSPGVIGIFKKEFGENAKVWDINRHIFIPEHFIFTADTLANANIRLMREFAKLQSVQLCVPLVRIQLLPFYWISLVGRIVDL